MSPAAAFPRPDREPTACFSVAAAAEPGVMPRVLELFAKRGLVPTHWCSRVSGRALVIHAGGDNYTDQPENGGGMGRIACGVVPKE